MKDKIYNLVAFDCGNSSIRVVLGTYSGEKIETKLIHQVDNYEININGKYYWDILYIFKELQVGLKKAYEAAKHIDSVGISTWGIDYGLISDKQGILSNPLCYRNEYGLNALDKLDNIQRKEIFNLSGIQCDKINTLYQILGYKEKEGILLDVTDKILLIPDLLVYLFTGEVSTEASITSTTQYYNVKESRYSDNILNKFSIEKDKLPKLIPNGEVRGWIRNDIAEDIGVNKCSFISVASHDTSSAVVSVPSNEEDFVFISSGTWSLIGTELNKPIINNKVYNKGFANEVGAYNTINLLKNSAGLYLAQRLKKEQEADGINLTWSEITSLAKAANDYIVINVNDEKFFNPKSMKHTINEEALRISGKALNYESLFKTVYYSLALNYKNTIKDLEEISNKKYNSIYIVGGGSKNEFLNEITSNITGKKVISGPEEATSIGNIAVQLSYFIPSLNLYNLRKIIKDSIVIKEYTPI